MSSSPGIDPTARTHRRARTASPATIKMITQNGGALRKYSAQAKRKSSTARRPANTAPKWVVRTLIPVSTQAPSGIRMPSSVKKDWKNCRSASPKFTVVTDLPVQYFVQGFGGNRRPLSHATGARGGLARLAVAERSEQRDLRHHPDQTVVVHDSDRQRASDCRSDQIDQQAVRAGA